MADGIKRLNYFLGQFLEAEDFQAEQTYHVGMRRRGHRALYYTAGILDGGFQVTKASDTAIRIGAGIGVDAQGRELVILAPVEKQIVGFAPTESFHVVLEYKETEEDPKTTADNASSGYTRLMEAPDIILDKDNLGARDPAKWITLASIVLDAAGNIGTIDLAVRQYANARFPRDLTVGQGGNGVLNVRHIDGKNWLNDNKDDVFLNWNTGKNVWLGFGANTTSSLFVSGNVGVGTAVPGARLTVQTPENYTGDTLRFESKNEPDRYRLNLSTVVTAGVVRWTIDQTNAGTNFSNVLAFDRGNVGIGTAEPKAKLQVFGGAIMPAAGNDANAGIMFPENPGGGGGDKAWIRYYSRGGERTALELGVANDAISDPGNQDDILLLPSGGVGIGTSSPGAKLEVIGGGGGTIDLKVNGRLQSNNNDGGLWVASDRFVGGHETNKIGFWNGNAWRLTVQNDGKVGVGTSTPGAKLDVVGTVRASGEIQSTSMTALRMVGGNFGSVLRNDGIDTYLLLTNPGDQYGSWNGLRPLRVNNTSGNVFLSNLDVGDSFSATVGCADFKIGHSSRRGAPGRALVDAIKNITVFPRPTASMHTLVINYDRDWQAVVIEGIVQTPSSRQLKENIESLSSQTAKRIIATLEPVRFTYKRDTLKLECLGFIAEDAAPEVASPNYDAIVMNHIVAALTRVVKDQERSLGELEAQVRLLKPQQA